MTRFLLLSLLFLLSSPALAQSFNGTLDTSDLVNAERNAYYDETTVSLEMGQITTIEMRSNDFDTYLIVRSPSGFTYENDDFQGDSSVSQVDLVADEAGTWTIWATAYSPDLTGTYTMNVTAGAVAEMETWEGRLDPRDRQTVKGEYVDTYEIELDQMTPITIELKSYGFDGFLVVQAPDGQYWRNDDAGSLDKSKIGPLAPTKGVWKLHVTTSRADEVGAYDLRVVYMPQE
ncbi:MAG: hypothetical protein AAGI71_16085 [Bacteroidota bacterium]